MQEGERFVTHHRWCIVAVIVGRERIKGKEGIQSLAILGERLN